MKTPGAGTRHMDKHLGQGAALPLMAAMFNGKKRKIVMIQSFVDHEKNLS
jgi:hypothetical protein